MKTYYKLCIGIVIVLLVIYFMYALSYTEENDCNAMSLKLNKLLVELGYDSHTCCNDKHCWVEVNGIQIEAQTLLRVNYMNGICYPEAISDDNPLLC